MEELGQMKAWTKIVARPTKANLAFALLSLLALFIVAWSRTDFSSPKTPIPTSDLHRNNALFAPLDIQLGPNVQEIAPIDSDSTNSTYSSGSRSVPSSVTVQASKQSPSQFPSLVSPIQNTTEALINIVSTPSANLTLEVPLVQSADQPECGSVLVLEVCLN